MQDRFKFRTYIPQKKFFKFWGYIDKGQWKGLCPSDDTSLDELLENYTNQCTGLKDKNGKLIFEGDIIRQRLSKAKFVIKYHNEYACFYEESKSFLGYFNDLTAEGLNSIEVIGNIYEDKEL